jgi:hypothetical protein
MLIRYADGRTLVGILLVLTATYLRVALKDQDDIAEFRLVSGRWVSEDCEPVTFEFPLAPFQAAGFTPGSELPESGPPRKVADAMVEPGARHLQ